VPQSLPVSWNPVLTRFSVPSTTSTAWRSGMEIQWDAAARRPGLPHGEPSTQWAREEVPFAVTSGLDRVDVRRLAARRREKGTAPAPCTLDGHRLRAFTLVLT
jgi:hypothetical protein